MSRGGLGALCCSMSIGLSIVAGVIGWTSGASGVTITLLAISAAMFLFGTGMIIGSRG